VFVVEEVGMLNSRIGDDLEIRLLEETDAKDLAGLAHGYNSEVQVNEWIFSGTSVEAARTFIQSCVENHSRSKGFAAGIWVEGRLAGVTVLNIGHSVCIPRPFTASIDYAIHPDFRGRGIVTQTCATVINHAFSELGINRIEIMPDIANVKSCAIPERLGFTKEGVLRQSVCYGRFYGDIAVYSLLRSEWEARMETSRDRAPGS
jgi:ribosomal-protein-serine acetyltransferase